MLRRKEGHGHIARASLGEITPAGPRLSGLYSCQFFSVNVGFIFDLISFLLLKVAFKMRSSSVLLMAVLAATVGLSVAFSSRPRYIGCQTSDECGKEACCVIGMGRYSIPTCQPRRELGEQCRPQGEPVNTTLHYPDGASVDLAGVFYVFCPCQGGYTCSDNMECVEHSVFENHIDQQYDYSEEQNFHY